MNANDLKAIGCQFFGAFKSALGGEMVLTRRRILPVGFIYRTQVLANSLTPSSAFPVAAVDGSNAIVLETGGVLVEIQLKVNFTGNAAGNRFFVGASVDSGAVVNVSNASNILSQVVFDQTTDTVITSHNQYSPYAGPYLGPGTRIVPVVAGNGGGSVYYALNIKYVDGRGTLHGDA